MIRMRIMMIRSSEVIRMETVGISKEYKREYTDDIKKTVIAFANTNGGEIWIGVADDNSVVGIADPDATILKVTNAIRNTIKPDITMHTLSEIRQIQGKNIVVVHVQNGTACPYYLTGGDRFETTRSLLQDLSFKQAEKSFQAESIKFGIEQKRTLALIGMDGSYTNLGLLLSDQCTHTIKTAVFEGTNKKIFKDRSEFSGSILKQLEDSYLYLDQFNHIRAEISGLKRIDMRSYPPEAIREALLNAVVHRDYSYSGGTLISIFEDRIEFVSLGGLPKGISYNDLLLGVSVPRNNHLADIFYRLHLIEAYGTGVPKIMEYYREYNLKPDIEVSDNAFKITLPNTNYNRSAESDFQDVFSYDEQMVLRYLTEHGNVMRKQLVEVTGFSQAKTIRVLNALISKSAIKKVGQGKNTYYSFH